MTTKILFICSKNRLRSPTAEVVFSTYDGIDAIGCGTSKEAECQISEDLIEWADLIFPMEKRHYNKITTLFGSALRNKKIIVLGIPDNYKYMDDELIQLLKAKVLHQIF